MADVSITTDAGQTAAALHQAANLVSSRVRAVVQHHGVLLQARVKAHAAGRPGPRMVSGDYNRSIGLRIRPRGANGTEANVGTNRPQGRRLEFGFRGVDSIGRRYDQPPYPHFGPALDETRPGFEASIAGIVNGIL